ncbi:MAG: DUF357 domain-containing protein [Candidatus Hydrothermota bacterium]|nr:MAG: DUF357 domain-containing protein [Candidatus Hydrothermae bacterium]
MDEKTRIKKDILMFKENLEQIKNKKLTKSQNKTLELAKQYYEDSKYYLDKKDFFTAFGCINYAHGLLDSIIKF